MIIIGSVIDYPTVHEKQVVGQVETILENTVVIRDKHDETHLVLKSNIEEDGFTIDEITNVHKTRYTRK